MRVVEAIELGILRGRNDVYYKHFFNQSTLMHWMMALKMNGVSIVSQKRVTVILED